MRISVSLCPTARHRLVPAIGLTTLLLASPLIAQDFPSGVSVDQAAGVALYDFHFGGPPTGQAAIFAGVSPIIFNGPLPNPSPPVLDFELNFDFSNLSNLHLTGNLLCIDSGGCPSAGLFGQVQLSSVVQPILVDLNLQGLSKIEETPQTVQGQFGLFDDSLQPLVLSPQFFGDNFAPPPLAAVLNPTPGGNLTVTIGALFWNLAANQTVILPASLDAQLTGLPIPEPHTVALCALGLSVVAVAARRRRPRKAG